MVTDEQLRRRKYDRLHFGNFNEQKIENKQDKNGKSKKNEKLSHTIIFEREKRMLNNSTYTMQQNQLFCSNFIV